MTAYEHIVVFRFGQPLPPEVTADLLSALLAFREEIPGILALSAGVNDTLETQNVHGYTLGLRITFRDREALRAYQPHPSHLAFVRRLDGLLLDGLLQNVVVVDYPLV